MTRKFFSEYRVRDEMINRVLKNISKKRLSGKPSMKMKARIPDFFGVD